MSTYTGLHYDETGLTLDAHPAAAGAWSATGVVAGSDSNETGKYEFPLLDDTKDYTIRVRDGASAAADDLVIATLDAASKATKTDIRDALNGRWTDEDDGFFDLTITDTP